MEGVGLKVQGIDILQEKSLSKMECLIGVIIVLTFKINVYRYVHIQKYVDR